MLRLAENSASYGRRQTYVWSHGLWGLANDVLGISGAQAEIFMSCGSLRVARVEKAPGGRKGQGSRTTAFLAGKDSQV